MEKGEIQLTQGMYKNSMDIQVYKHGIVEHISYFETIKDGHLMEWDARLLLYGYSDNKNCISLLLINRLYDSVTKLSIQN